MGQLGDLSPQESIAVGVIVGLISTSLQAIGLTLQRKSHLLEDEKRPYDLHRPPYKRRRWQLGMFMFVISNIVGSTIQITTLPLPVLSTLQASGLVFNTIFATLVLGELFTRFSLVGTILVCIGAVLIAVFGAIGEPAHTLDQLLALLYQRSFILWMAGTATVATLVLLMSRLLKLFSSPSRSRSPRDSVPYLSLLTTPRVKLLRGLSYGFVSGILSAHSLLLAKSAVELLVRTIIDHVNQFDRWQSWVILIGMIILALTQLYYMHRGLKLCSTSVLYPFVFCIYNITAILDGLIYFRQASQLAGLHAGLIALGTVVLLAGVLCLSWRLDVIDTHAGVTIVAAQPALGPGLGIAEERAGSVSDDEEMQAAEHEPLLRKSQSRPGYTSYRRTPSLPLLLPYRRRTQTFTDESAQIWAELEDSENEVTPTEQAHMISSSNTSFGGRDQNRLRSKTFASGSGESCSPFSADTATFASAQKGSDLGVKSSRDPAAAQHPVRVSISRRTTAPVSPRRNRLRIFSDEATGKSGEIGVDEH
ncbi:hypothetical protein Egran_00599 [Elaphomyces granulatus]|uniref:Uncharacterized protein n=1 Tax=Elaphomyces granulatus TaxID=519963 RepID=A0A232M5C6_9EURO|nr:hypothetical protein Egran_00599 [Elaphomyces granulatus]